MRTHALRFAAFATLLAAATPALAEEAPTLAGAAPAPVDGPKNIIRMDALDLASGTLSVEYERVLGRHLGLGITGGASLYEVNNDSILMPSRAYDVLVRPMIYLQGTAPTGWYLSPFAAVAVFDHGLFSTTGFFAGAMVGCSWLVAEHLHLEVAAGAQYVDLEMTVDDGNGASHTAGIRGVGPAGEVGIGLAF
jgi:hypothetical protein